MREDLRVIKNKTREDIVEEAYQYLEIDNPERVEGKKKGITLAFLINGHPLFKDLTPDITQMPPVKAKLRNFTDEQKEDIRERAR